MFVLKGGSLTLGQSLLYKVMSEPVITKCNFVCLQIEKSQGEIYRLRAKLESTQTENENMHDELEKMQQALNRSYADRDKIASDLEKMRDELERSQVNEKESIIKSSVSVGDNKGSTNRNTPNLSGDLEQVEQSK